ncbi:MAG TPA: response regulator transcription factor [Burkholderiales bacterium]|nr:response regulator transcription factor [Burkholderiales bacterium]
MKVYVVEDSSLMRNILINMLRSIDGADIVGEAEKIAVAITGIAKTQPDVIVLDLHLIDGSGFDVLLALKNIAPEVVTIVFSNNNSPPIRRECMAAGARHFFDKSDEFEKLRETLIQLSQPNQTPR